MIDTKDMEARKMLLAELIGTKLSVGGKTLEQKLKRAGRLLPRWARRDAQRIVEAGRLAAHPKLARQIDIHALDKAQARITRYLNQQDPKERRIKARLHLAGDIVLKLLIIGTALVAVLRWQGLI